MFSVFIFLFSCFFFFSWSRSSCNPAMEFQDCRKLFGSVKCKWQNGTDSAHLDNGTFAFRCLVRMYKISACVTTEVYPKTDKQNLQKISRNHFRWCTDAKQMLSVLRAFLSLFRYLFLALSWTFLLRFYFYGNIIDALRFRDTVNASLPLAFRPLGTIAPNVVGR